MDRHALRQRDHLPRAIEDAQSSSRARSLMFGENAVRMSVAPISSASGEQKARDDFRLDRIDASVAAMRRLRPCHAPRVDAHGSIIVQVAEAGRCVSCALRRHDGGRVHLLDDRRAGNACVGAASRSRS